MATLPNREVDSDSLPSNFTYYTELNMDEAKEMFG